MTTPCSRVTPQPSRACSPRRSRWSSTRRRRRAEAPRLPRCSRAGRSTWPGRPQAMHCPASPDTSSAARRRGGTGRRRRRQRGVRAGPARLRRTSRQPRERWSYGVFARDAAGNVALIGTVANVVVVDKTPPLAPTKLTVTRPKAKTKSKSITFTLHWVKPTAADLDRIVVVLNLRRAPVGPADGKTVYHGLGTSTKVKLLPGADRLLRGLRLRPQRQRLAQAAAQGRVAGRADLAAAALRQLRAPSPRPCSPGRPRRAARTTTCRSSATASTCSSAGPARPPTASRPGMLKSGTYVWYVWPAVQHAGSSPTFGKLIGRATFTYKKK